MGPRIQVSKMLTIYSPKRHIGPEKPQGECPIRAITITITITITIFFPKKPQILENLKNISCNRNEPKQCIYTRQITEVSNSMKRHADNSGNHSDLRRPLKI